MHCILRLQKLRAHSATACPPSGSRTRPLGWLGRTIPKTGRESFRPFPGSTLRSCACSRRMNRCISSSKTRRCEKRVRGILKRAGANLDRVSFHNGPPTVAGRATPAPSLSATRRPSRPHQLALQRLGQILRLASGRPGSRPRAQFARIVPVAANRATIDGTQPTDGPRRRLHRYQWRGNSAHYRRMPAERSAAAQSRR